MVARLHSSVIAHATDNQQPVFPRSDAAFLGSGAKRVARVSAPLLPVKGTP